MDDRTTPMKPHRLHGTKSNSVPASTGEMRAFLLSQMIAVANGEQDHPTAQSICRYAQQVYNMTKLELRAAEIASKRGDMTIDSLEFRREPSA
jgi:hypothetical protein